jgi:uncharacterized protein YhaN
MPGFEKGGSDIEGLSEDVNIIFGPNESGKTTLADSIGSILWPSTAPDTAHLEASFEVADQIYTATHRFGGTKLQPGSTIADLDLPSATSRDRYLLALEHLLRDNNRKFASIIKQESAGGYNFEDLRENIQIRQKPSRTLGITRKANKLRTEIQQARAEDESLEREAQQLETKRQKLERLKTLEPRLDLLDNIIEYKDLEQQCRKKKSRLEAFPEEIEHIRGHEYEQIAEINSELEQLTRDRDQKSRRLDSERKKLEELDVGESLSSADIKSLKSRLEDLENKKRDLEKKEHELERIRGRNKQLETFLDSDAETSYFAGLDREAIRDIKDLIDEHRRLAEQDDRIEAFKSVLGLEDSIETTPTELRDAISLLERWLKTADSERTSPANKYLLIAAVAGLILVTTVGAFLSWWLPIGYIVGTVVFAVVIWWHTASDAGHSSTTRDIERDYDSLDIPSPEAWARSDVSTRLNHLRNQLADVVVAKRKTEELRRLKAQTNSERRSELADAVETKLHELGLEQTAPLEQDERVIDRIFEHQELLEEVAERRSAIDNLRSRLDAGIADLLDKITGELLAGDGVRELLSHHEESASASDERQEDTSGERLAGTETNRGEQLAAIDGHLQELKQQLQQKQKLNSNIERLQADLEQLERRIDDARTKRAEIFESANLSPENLGKLKSLCDQIEQYRNVEQSVNHLERQLEEKHNHLQTFSDFDEAVLESPREELVSDREQLERKLSDKDSLLENISRLEARIQQAKESTNLEGLIADRGELLAELEDRREQNYREITAGVLVDFIEQKTRDRDRPEVFDRAKERFKRLTHGRYRLDFDSNSGEFLAHDTTEKTNKDLDSLSSGTRLQLLISVRLAFIDTRERGLKVPVVFDETLANSDRRRARQVINSAISMTREGRQVFYMTAQRDEVARWENQLADRQIDHQVVHLGKVQNHSDSTLQWTGTGDMTDIPAPKDRTHDEYRQALNIDNFHPWRPATNCHLWYLTESPGPLATCLEYGLSTWGEFKHITEEGNPERLGLTKRNVNNIWRRGLALESFCKHWRKGRGEPVPADAILQTDAVSDTFESDVLDLVDTYEGNAEDILSALRNGEVKRFRSDKIEQLKTEWLDQQYIDKREPLEDDDILNRVMTDLTEKLDLKPPARVELRSLIERLSGVPVQH